ncbi:hypothetical protein [Ktedonobacter sp. SOSP1-85]|uniref:hypothetical protein n=1 Tax=Ktedonobacter sp. SOSP1-85 TaxID=2778367 RepID=UPI001914ED59|nr:hypothetical protein [Ktedonobacter sp. SOSP1-85]
MPGGEVPLGRPVLGASPEPVLSLLPFPRLLEPEREDGQDVGPRDEPDDDLPLQVVDRQGQSKLCPRALRSPRVPGCRPAGTSTMNRGPPVRLYIVTSFLLFRR